MPTTQHRRPAHPATRWRRRKAYGIVFLLVLALLVGLADRVLPEALHARRHGHARDRPPRQPAAGELRRQAARPARRRGAPRRGHADGARLELALQPDEVAQIPSNVTARLLPKTLFGERYVDLVTAGPAGAPDPGGRRHPAGPQPVSIELETVLDNLYPLLRTVQPAKLATTLNALSTTLDGRGDQIGRNLVLVDRYLKALNPSMPTHPTGHHPGSPTPLTSTPASPPTSSASPSPCGSPTRPSSRRTSSSRPSSSARPVSPTRRRASCATTSSASSRSARSASRPCSCSRSTRPIYPCVASGLVNWLPRANAAFAGGTFHITLEVVPPRQPYRPGEEPRWDDKRGPHCYGLPTPGGSQSNPFAGNHFDDGTQPREHRASPSPPCRRRCSATPPPRTPAAPARPMSSASSAPSSPATASPPTGREQHPDPARRSDDARHGGEHPMKVKGSLVKLIIFAAVTLFATSILALTIANIQLGSKATYTAVVSDATGVIPGQDVRIAGVRVGEVTDVRVARDATSDGATADIDFSVLKSSVLTQGTEVTVKYRNLVGQRYLALSQGAGAPAPLADGSTIPLSRTHPALDLTVLFNGFKPLFAALSPSDVNELSGLLIQTLQGEGGDVNTLLAKTAGLTSAIADRDAVIGRTIDNLNTVLGTVDAHDQQLLSLIDQLQRLHERARRRPRDDRPLAVRHQHPLRRDRRPARLDAPAHQGRRRPAAHARHDPQQAGERQGVRGLHHRRPGRASPP